MKEGNEANDLKTSKKLPKLQRQGETKILLQNIS